MKKLLFLILIVSNHTKGQVLNKPQHDPPVVINHYASVISYEICDNAVLADTATFFGAGDTVLIIQMKGAVIDTGNTSSFGTILDYKNAGNYEFNYISQRSGNQLYLKNKLTKTYDFNDGYVQLVRVPSYINAFFVSGLTCMPWDGKKGGILAVIATNSLTSWNHIVVSGKGFRAGEGYNAVLPPSNCFQNNYNYSSTSQLSGFKGESIADVQQSINKGKGSPAGGGGAGLSHNSGGGGGGNGGMGGYGGFQSDTCGATPFDNRGLGGKNLFYAAAADKIFMGSGGGAGHGDNTGLFPGTPGGGAGGGIIIIITDTLIMDDHQIFSNGSSGQYCYSLVDCNDGMGGGGAGGSVLLKVNTIIDTLTVDIAGGNGGNVIAPISPGGRVGPGGGGGGGVFFINTTSLPSNTEVINNGGTNGVIALDAANPWGATAGNPGLVFFSLSLPFDTVLFTPNIDSVRINDSVNYCNNVRFTGLAYTNTNPVVSWKWYFGDGDTSSLQNPVHTYSAVADYDVKLVVTDMNGCTDSLIKTINTAGPIFADAGADTMYCTHPQKPVVLQGNGTGSYSWMPAAVLNNNTLQNPIAIINNTTKFYLTVSNGAGCSSIDSVTISLRPGPPVQATKTNDLNCNKPFTQLHATGASTYTWLPAYALSNDSIASPVANPAITTTYYVYGKDTSICAGADSITVIADFKNHGIILPNSFTPNNDGLNDCFGIKYYRDIKELTFIIFNRHGNAVFKTTNPNECWDGNFNGKPASSGSFVYLIKAKTFCGDVFIQDNVMLLR